MKTDKLKRILKKYKSVLVAFSGGVDSTLLLKVALGVLGPKNVLAVIASSETYPADEIKQAIKLAKRLKSPWVQIQTYEFENKRFASNPTDRCFYCKMELFSKLKKIAKEKKLHVVVEGSNVDDLSDFRPGTKAKKKLGVKSPLQKAGFTKKDIRSLAKKLKLSNWNKPSFACLSSRIPYGTAIEKEVLVKVGKAEEFLKTFKLGQVRVRHHGNIARIEVDKKAIKRICKFAILDKITKRFKKLGYKYVTLDLAGYRTGSMNEVL